MLNLKSGKKSTFQRQFSAGGAVYKKEGDNVLWLLVQPRGGEKFYDEIRWQLPKGWLEIGEKSEEAAVREVAEEGGVEAKIIGKIDTIKIFFKNTFEGRPKETVLKTIAFFLMEYQKDTPEGFGSETQEIIWTPFKEAIKKLTFKSEKEILKKADELLEKSRIVSQKSLF